MQFEAIDVSDSSELNARHRLRFVLAASLAVPRLPASPAISPLPNSTDRLR